MTRQVTGDLVSPGIEFAIRQPQSLILERYSIGRALGLRLKEFVDATVARVVHGCLIPIYQHLLALTIGEYRQCRNPLVRLANDRMQEMDEILRQSLNGLRVEQIGAVLESSVVTSRVLVEMKSQIKRGELQIKIKATDIQVANSAGIRGQHLQGDLKDWVPTWVPFKFQVFHHHF